MRNLFLSKVLKKDRVVAGGGPPAAGWSDGWDDGKMYLQASHVEGRLQSRLAGIRGLTGLFMRNLCKLEADNGSVSPSVDQQLSTWRQPVQAEGLAAVQVCLQRRWGEIGF